MRYFIIITLLSLPVFADTQKNETECPDGKQHYRTTLRHIESGGIGYDEGYTTLEAFFASDPSLWPVTPFLDVRGHVFDNGKWAANAGVGVRGLWKNRSYGINTFYDYRNPGNFNANQVGAGLESLGELIDFRINGYWPVGRATSDPYTTKFKTFSGNNALITQQYQSAMTGTNIELGVHFGQSKLFDFYAAAGPYYFTESIGPSTWGGKGRISVTYKDILSLELSDSYDSIFHNRFQGQISLRFSFGPKSKINPRGHSCKSATSLNARMLQPVDRQEIIVINDPTQDSIAINPLTNLPYFFIFVNNMGNSNGTYESPYHNFAQVEANSSPNDIVYVFPGDGTTTGMTSGITLQANQKLWGSGISYLLQTSKGTISIPAQSSTSPTITNTDMDTAGNAITLATNNAISGLIIDSAINDAIYGADPQNLEVSSCTIENTSTFAIETSFSDNTSISLTNNQFLNNANGASFSLNGTSSLTCLNNTFRGQTSVSETPLNISANSNTFTTHIENNTFDDNTTGSIRFNLQDVVSASITVANNTITNNDTGAQGSLASSFVIISDGNITYSSIALENNTFSNNTSNALYLHTSGIFTTLEVTASENTASNNGGSALVLATPVDNLTLTASNNLITNCTDNAIAVIASGSSSTGTITINSNTITDIENTSNGIAINQNFSTLDLTLSNNEIRRCEGTGVVSYASSGIDSLTLSASSNIITDCQNLSSNAAAGISIEQYTTLIGSLTNNTLSDNTGLGVKIGSDLSGPTSCLTLTNNTNNTDYLLTNPGDGTFNLSPCNVDSINTGTINTSGTIDLVQSCSSPTPCPP